KQCCSHCWPVPYQPVFELIDSQAVYARRAFVLYDPLIGQSHVAAFHHRFHQRWDWRVRSRKCRRGSLSTHAGLQRILFAVLLLGPHLRELVLLRLPSRSTSPTCASHVRPFGTRRAYYGLG